MFSLFSNENELKVFVNKMMVYLKEYMEGALAMDRLSLKPARSDADKIVLKEMTALMSIDDDLRSLIGISMSQRTLKHITEGFCSGLELAEKELLEIQEETAADLLNLCVGQCLAEVDPEYGTVQVTPPMVSQGNKQLYRRDWAYFAEGSLKNKKGEVTVFCFFPKEGL